jgi:hypothetical protein
MRVPVIAFDGIDIDRQGLSDALRLIEDDLGRASVADGVPIAPVETS